MILNLIKGQSSRLWVGHYLKSLKYLGQNSVVKMFQEEQEGEKKSTHLFLFWLKPADLH